MSKEAKRFLYASTVLSVLLMGNTGVLATEVSTTQSSVTKAITETSESSNMSTESTSESQTNSTVATSSSSLETSSTSTEVVEQSTEESVQQNVQQSESSVDEAQNETQDTSEKVYDLTIGLDPTDSNRSDLKERVGSLNRVKRSTRSIAAVVAGDKSTPKQDFIDVSSHNGIISVAQYKTMKSYGVTAVVVKLTEGTSYKNPLAASQIANAQAAGLIVHGYHYSWFTTEAQAKAEADYFVKYAKEVKLPTSALMVNDIEDNQIKGKANHTALSKVFVNRIKALGYSNTHHYVGVSWVNEKAIDPAVLGYNNVWIANYPYVPASQKFTEYSAWQWTSNLSFPGVSGTFDMSSDYQKYFVGQSQGEAIKDNRYATITKDNYNIWQNFSWKKKADSKTYLGQTFQIRYRYEHSNGHTYYSLYNNKGTWVGYIDAGGTKTATIPQGSWRAKEQFVKFREQGTVYRDINFKTTATVTGAMLNNLYKVTGTYQHFNGTVYDSVYDLNGKWIGYIETTKLSKQGNQGPAISDGRYTTITKDNYSIWQNFGWKLRASSSSYLHQTLKIKYRYEHLNGDVYFSVYDNKDHWVGYINAKGTKVADNAAGAVLSSGQYGTIRSANYPIWQNFSWKERNQSANLYGQTVQVKRYYHHFNGSTYYSMYDNQGNWLGYMNSGGVKLAANAAGSAQSYQKKIRFTKNYPLWHNFAWKKKSTVTDAMKNTTYEARYVYRHFNGSNYLSIYDNKGTWLGYVNETATRQVN
jgi:hypothetical protein